MANINNYELLNALGSGTYATVHKAIDKRTRQVVAVKVMERKKILRAKLSIDNLIQEIGLLKKLQHKYIVKMEDFCWDSTNIYIIMELCETSLSSFIRKRTRLSESTCRIFIRMLADAMKYLRNNNVCHFDLKPQNLLLTKPNASSTYVLKICDFG
jgi:serine/threonine protein kinase